ncbi:DMT family transporter [Blastochloris viridis]|uniref:Membrane protein n=1 Tax=Blastochloris viridis TaxID=1079 RepID=A0A0H5BCF6_BLAVI|nr:DMT family transporter [Blastochloris viridis]ALK08727.1 EamA-like transporter family protein [Blastochloris viridis]BAR97976.1 membrane protein [Blastochloris viridis]CUU41389.1 putative permeases [Blastochloris viridis]
MSLLFKGVLFKLLAVLCFSAMSALIRHIGTAVPAGEVVCFRAFFNLVPLLLWLGYERQLASAVRTANPLGHFFRSFTGILAMFFMFTGLALLPLAEATAIGFAMPLIAVAFAALFLKEQVRAFRWSAVVVGMVGVVIILWPRFGEDLTSTAAIGAAASLIGAVLSAAAIVQIRRLTQTETTGAIVFYFSVYSTVLALATAPFGWVMPDGATTLLLIAIGVLGGVAQILMTQSYRYADASLLAPFDYTAIVWALALGLVAFHEVPGPMVLVGSLVVVGAGLAVIWRERRLGLRRTREREATPAE